MEKIVNSLMVKDLKGILEKNGVSFEKKLRKPALQEKLKEFLSNELTKLVTSKEDEILQLLPDWSFSLSKEKGQWSFYHCVSKVSCGTISDALALQKNAENGTSDDESSVIDRCNSSVEEDSEISCSVSLGSDSSASTTQKANIDPIDPMIHIGKSTFDFSMDMNQKEKSKHSRLGFRERNVRKQQKLISARNSKKLKEDEKQIETLKCHNLFCCDATDPVTKSRCIAGPFVSEYLLKKHIESKKHIFPSINSTTAVLIDIQQGKTSPLCLACGALPNRDDAAAGIYEVKPAQRPIPECIDPLCVGPGCYRRDNKLWKHKQFRASPELLSDLEALFQDGENRSKEGVKRNAGKYNATEAVAVLKNMMNSNGRRKYRIDGHFGNLPTTKYVKSWFARRKNKGAKVFLSNNGGNKDPRKKDRFTNMNLDQLKEAFEVTFECAPTRKILCQKVLEIDDELKFGGHDNFYSGLKLNELEEECQDRKLPFAVGQKGLLMILRNHTGLLKCKEHTSSIQYNDAVNITDAAEQILLRRKK